MKQINKIFFTLLLISTVNAGFSQDVSIFITAPNGGNISVGQTAFLDLQVCNNSSSVNTPVYKLRPIVNVPSGANGIIINAIGHVLPPGWTILTQTTGSIRFSNGTDAFTAQTCRNVLISVTGASTPDGQPQTISATMNFSNGIAPGSAVGPATVGNITTNDNATTAIILPITLGDFTASITDCNAKLSWHTLQEVNTLKFVIEKSTDAANWQAVSEIRAAGNSSIRRNYTATDNMLEGGKATQYRLKMVDVDDKVAYSSVVSVASNCKARKVVVFPNPVQNNSFNVFVTGFAEKATATLRAADGRLVFNKPVREGNNLFNVVNLARGTYFLSIEDNNGNKVKQKVSVIK